MKLNLFPTATKKKVIIYDSALKPCYEAKVNHIEDDQKLLKLIANCRLFLKIDETYYYRTVVMP